MNSYSLTHLADQVLLRDLSGLVARDRTNTAALLAHIAEVDARKLYVPAAHPCMLSYCVHVLRLSEDAALKRIRAGRTAREYPAIFTAVAEGKLHLTGVVLLKPHLTAETADDLLTAAAHKSKSEIELLLAQRFPQPELPSEVGAIAQPTPLLTESLVPEPVSAGTGCSLVPEPVEAPVPRAKVAPVAPQRFAVQFTMGQAGYEDLRNAQSLLSHQNPPPDVAEVFEGALRAYVRELEKRKFAATQRPHKGRRRETKSARHVPAHVKNAVWERDGGQCTFVSEAGERCPARARLEFDHIDGVARGGQATIASMRILCRVHNQYEAERMYGTEFMNQKREEARRVAAARAVAAAKPVATVKPVAAAKPVAAVETRAAAACVATERAPDARAAAEELAAEARAAAEEGAAAARAAAEERVAATAREAEARSVAAERVKELDVVPCLRNLGFRAEEARLAAQHCDSIPDASMEVRVRAALKFLCASKGRAYGSRPAA